MLTYAGHGRKQSNGRAREIIERYISRSIRDSIPGSFDPALARKLQSILRKERRYKILTLGLMSAIYRRASKQVASIINAVPTEDDPNNARMAKALEMKPRPLQPFLDRMWALGVNGPGPEWPNILAVFEGQKAGLAWEDISRSTDDFGLTYNRRNDYGVLEAGTLLTPSDTEAKEGLLKTGHGRFLGIEGTKDGKIYFSFEQPRSYPGLLLCNEDIDVALTLIFGGPKPVWPTFSLDEAKKGAGKDANFLRLKNWNPPWLADTLFGKTMYACDYLIGQLAWQTPLFETRLIQNYGKTGVNRTEPTNLSLDLDQSRFAIETSKVLNAYRVLDAIYHQPMADQNEHLNLHPRRINWDWTTEKDGTLRCKMGWIRMEVYGGLTSYLLETPPDQKPNTSFWDEELPRGDKWLASSTRPARVGYIMSHNFEQLAVGWPILERQRQLLGLLYALHELRKRGFQPDKDIRKRINNVKRGLTTRPVPSQRHRLVLGHYWG
jgi:hypothetical protein